MHEAVPRIAGKGIALLGTDPERLELRGFAGANDAIVGRAVCLRHATDLRIGQPFGTPTALGAQQSQGCATDIEAPATVVTGNPQPQGHLTLPACTGEQLIQPAQIDAPIFEHQGIESLLPQERANVVIEGCGICPATRIRQGVTPEGLTVPS